MYSQHTWNSGPKHFTGKSPSLKQCGGGGTGSYGTVTDEDLSRSITQELPLSIPEELSYKHPTQRIFKILLQGPLEEDFNRIFSQGPVPDHAPGPFQELLARDHAKASGSISLKILKSPQYVRTRSFKALEQDPLAGNFKENLTTTGRQPAQSKCTWTFGACASLCSRNGHGHVTGAISRENLQEKGREAKRIP